MAHFLSKKYKTKISDTDYDIISLGRKITLGGKEGTEFGKSSRDYIEMNIFNTNGTLLDSIRLNETNKYIDESGEFKINPGIIMRRNGYFSGDYEIEFNFLREVAGSSESVLVNENKIEFLENKAKFYEEDIARYDKELQQILDNISNLSTAKSRSIQVKDTSVVGGVRNTISTSELRLAQNRINVEEENRKAVNQLRTVAADSLQKYKLEILSLENNTETVGELGPLQYLSGLTGTSMDKIINILLLIIIFVFDPLAISLVVAANFAFDIANRKNLYGEYDNSKKDFPKSYSDEDEKRMDIIGQNGNDVDHYDINVEDPEIVIGKEKLNKSKIIKVLEENSRNYKVVNDSGDVNWVPKDQVDKNKKKYL